MNANEMQERILNQCNNYNIVQYLIVVVVVVVVVVVIVVVVVVVVT